MKRLEFLPEVEDEVLNAFRHYQRERKGLGQEFRAELKTTLNRIRRMPSIVAPIHADVRYLQDEPIPVRRLLPRSQRGHSRHRSPSFQPRSSDLDRSDLRLFGGFGWLQAGSVAVLNHPLMADKPPACAAIVVASALCETRGLPAVSDDNGERLGGLLRYDHRRAA